jgi:hypothetical protein
MTEQKKWGEVGRELAVKLNGATDEEVIKSLGEAVSREILNRESTSEGRANALKMINRKLLKHFPRLRSEAPTYWHDPERERVTTQVASFDFQVPYAFKFRLG